MNREIKPSGPGASRTIFDSPSQRISVDPATIRMLQDRCLIRDLPQDDSRYGSLVLPETAQHGGVGKQGNLRIGVVIAVGIGDQFLEVGLDAQGSVRRKLITKPCDHCEGVGFDPNCPALPSLVEWDGQIRALGAGCPACNGEGRIPVVIPTQCKVGEIVCYDRRRECEVVIDGIRYSLLYSEQSVLGVIDGE